MEYKNTFVQNAGKMIVKSNKPLIFATDLHWKGDSRSSISSNSVKQRIIVAPYSDVSDNDNEWGSEHLFLSAVTSALFNSYLDFAKKMKIEIAGFECTATGQVEITDGKPKFTYIHTYPRAYIIDEGDIEKAQLALEKAKKNSSIYNSINAEVIQHPEVVLAKPQTGKTKI